MYSGYRSNLFVVENTRLTQSWARMMEYTAAKIKNRQHWEFQGLEYNVTGEGDLSDFSLCMVYVC